MSEYTEKFDSGLYQRFNGRKIKNKELRTLVGLIEGVCIDGQVNQTEIKELKGWLECHNSLFRTGQLQAFKNALDDILADEKVDPDEIEDMRWLADRLASWTDAEDLIKCVIQELHGAFHGIIADRKIDDEELKRLQNWVFDNEFLKGVYPYDEIASLLVEVFKDGKVTEDERKLILSFMADFIDFSSSENLSYERYKELKEKYTLGGICAADPEIEFEGKNFCFTGESSKATRSEIEKKIVDAGGSFQQNPTKSTDYLVVGNCGNRCWAFAAYGRKIEKAMELRKKGSKIVIVNEIDFWDAF